MKVLRFIIQHLHNEEWFQFMTEFKKEVEAFGAGALNVYALFTPFVVLYSKADELLMLIRKSLFTKQEEAADKERDHVFSALLKTVQALCHMPGQQIQEAAGALLLLLEHYKKDILHGGYDEESGAITNLLQDLAGPYALQVELLNLIAWVTALANAQERFLALRGERYEESAAKPKSDLQKLRLAADRYYLAMANQFDAYLLGAGYVTEDDVPAPGVDDPVYNFVVRWNEHVKNYKHLLAQRSGRRKAASSEEEEV
jgi:hypothetical protein